MPDPSNTTSTPAPAPVQDRASLPPSNRAPGLMLRLAAMTYEAVLLFGVVFILTYAVLALARWTFPLLPYQRLALQALLFVAVGLYFTYCWSRSGQTLAMKSWHLRVVDRTGRSLRPRQAIARYLLAWHLFAPGLLFVALFRTEAAWQVLALALGLLAMLALARLDPDRQLLHDRLLGTRVIRD